MSADLQAYVWFADAAFLSVVAWAVHNPWHALAVALVGMPPVLLVLYGIGVQGRRGGAWRILYLLLIPAWPLDVVSNYTSFVILTLDFPRWAEFTFSQRLKRLQYVMGWAGNVARPLVRLINRLDPKHNHIPP